jgi:hypothetical protein
MFSRKFALLTVLPLLFLAPIAGPLSATDHSFFINQYEGPSTCLACHQNAMGDTEAVALEDILHSVHYRFESRLPEGYQFDEAGAEVGFATSGKLWKLCGFPTTVPQFNWLGNLRDLPETPYIDKPGGCAQCHIGVGFKPFNAVGQAAPGASDMNNIDCLVCHAKEYERQFFTSIKNGSPEIVNGNPVVLAAPRVDGTIDWDHFTEAAKTVTSTSYTTCLRCHVEAGGGTFLADDHNYASFKRGSIYGEGADVHADAGLSCADCHYAGGHRYERPLNNDLSAHDVVADREMCLDCHDPQPHSVAAYNEHMGFLACTSCHAQTTGGATFKDFSVVVPPDPQNPLAIYNVLVKFATPDFGIAYKWFNGTIHGEIQPRGSRGDGKIHPYKPIEFNQPLDAAGHPIPIQWGPLYKTGNMNAALTNGRNLYAAMWTQELSDKYGLPPVPGEFDHYGIGECGGFSISHGITKERALKCASCHNPTSVMDFEQLGYTEEETETLTGLLGLPMVGDFDGDNDVDAEDLLMFQEFWHQSEGALMKELQK